VFLQEAQGIIKMKADRDAEASKALALLLHVKGELVWFVRLSADNVLRMDFGSTHLKIREPNPHASGNSQAVIDALGRRMVTPTGKWHLFISEGEWSVTTKFYACSRSDTNAEHINATLRQLDGQRLVNVNRKNERHGWSLEFDLGAILHINSPESLDGGEQNEEVQWTLFCEDGNYASYTNDGNLRHKGHENS
jgi:hypothetical protein